MGHRQDSRAEGEPSFTVTRSATELSSSLYVNIPEMFRDKHGIEKKDDVTVEIFPDFIAIIPGGE